MMTPGLRQDSGTFLGILGHIMAGHSCGLNGRVGALGVGGAGVAGSPCGGLLGGIGHPGAITLDGHSVAHCDPESWEGCLKQRYGTPRTSEH